MAARKKRTKGKASGAAKGAAGKKAKALEYAATRQRARLSKPWKPPTKSVDTRARALLVSADVVIDAARMILAAQAVMLSDAVESIHHKSVMQGVETREISGMVSAHKELMKVLTMLGIASDDDEGGELDPLMLMSPAKKVAKKAPKKKAKKAAKKTKKKRRRKVDQTLDELMGDV